MYAPTNGIPEAGDVLVPYLGIYELENSEFQFPSAVTLQDNNRFNFNLHVFSSHIPMGTYYIEDNRLILTVDRQVAYIFLIEDDTLIFVAEGSRRAPAFLLSADATSPTPAFEDGSRFVLRR
jgi:hypothetical protein